MKTDKIRRMRKAKIAFLTFLCQKFGRDNKSFFWKDVVGAGWTGRRWNLAKLYEEHYLRHSRKVKGAYTYARGASKGAKYGQVISRQRRKFTISPSVSVRRKADLSSQEADLLDTMEEIDRKIEELTAAKEELNRAYMAIEALPKVSELLVKTKKALGK